MSLFFLQFSHHLERIYYTETQLRTQLSVALEYDLPNTDTGSKVSVQVKVVPAVVLARRWRPHTGDCCTT